MGTKRDDRPCALEVPRQIVIMLSVDDQKGALGSRENSVTSFRDPVIDLVFGVDPTVQANVPVMDVPLTVARKLDRIIGSSNGLAPARDPCPS